MTNPQVQIIYDKQCPICELYCSLIRLEDDKVPLKLVDARDNPDQMTEISDRGWDIDQGMVVIIGDAWYYGSDAIHKLAMVTGKSGFLNRIGRWVFSSERRAKWLYPVFRSMRNLLLKALRITKINNLNKADNDRF